MLDYNFIIDSRYVNVGLFYLNQVSFSAFDLRVHMDQGQSLACDYMLARTDTVRTTFNRASRPHAALE